MSQNTNQIEEIRISLLVLLPAASIDAPVEAKIESVLLHELSLYTRLDDENWPDDHKGSIQLNGSHKYTPRPTELALRRLRLIDSPRSILSERFQENPQQIAWIQFDLKKPCAASAFWQQPNSSDNLKQDRDCMDLFVVIENRYANTEKYFTLVDSSEKSKEIRLVVLPPSHGMKSPVLHCEFRNVRLGDASIPPYQTLHIAGPDRPRDGRHPAYNYDITINGHLCVSSDGMRVGLEQMQDEKEERLVWNHELCINCRDGTDASHFARLRDEIHKGATGGGVLMHDRLSNQTPIMNHNGGFSLPVVKRSAREIRLLQFLRANPEEELRCKIVVKDLDHNPPFKALSYTWGDASGFAMHYTTYQPDDDLSNWPSIKNSSSKVKFLQDWTDFTEFIVVNKMRIMITAHLGAALRCLRDRGNSKYFWIDALCIDQTDWEDRSSQVQMMGHIYSTCQQVIAWLGPGHAGEQTLEILNELGAEEFDLDDFISWLENSELPEEQPFNKSKSPGNAVVDDSSLEHTKYLRMRKYLQNSNFKNSVDTLVNLEWWHRLWVYQESILPTSLILHQGLHSIAFENLWKAIRLLLYLSDLNLPTFAQVPQSIDKGRGTYSLLAGIRQERNRRHIPGYPGIANEWLANLESLATRSASDPRDVIYAALGLTTGPPKITPDYSKSVMDVYTSAARQTIKHYDDLTILSMCGGIMDRARLWADRWLGSSPQVRKLNAPLPTWAPLWGEQNRKGIGTYSIREYLIDAPAFCAGGSGAVGAKFSKDGRTLFVKGVVVDVVSNVIPGYNHSKALRSGAIEVTWDGTKGTQSAAEDAKSLYAPLWHHAFSNWEAAVAKVQPNESDYVAGGTHGNAFMHCLHAPFLKSMLTGGSNDDIDADETLSEFKTFNIEGKNEEYRFLHRSDVSQTLFARDSAAPIPSLTISKGYELLTTEKGYIGVCPPGCEQVGGTHPGDIIVVLTGGSVPFILRRVGNHDRYLLVGDAYVHGLMYGSAMNEVKDIDLSKFPII